MKKRIKARVFNLLYSGNRYFRLLIYIKGKPMLKGDDVSKVQMALNKKGYKCSVDSYYGPESMTAVRSYQNDNCLTVDGIVGKETWGSLIE